MTGKVSEADGSDPMGEVRLRPIRLRSLLRIEVTVSHVVEVTGSRRYVPLIGGTFAGRGGLRGVVLPGGSDWQRLRSDGSLEIEAHYALRTDDGSGIEVHSSGIRRASPEVVERIATGEPVDPDDYYFRTHIRLAATGAAVVHLDGLLGVATGQREQNHVHIHVHEVL